MLVSANKPRSGLFKYFGIDADKLERFANRQIYFTPPKYFNDPWDFLARSDACTTAHIAREIPLLTGQELKEFTEHMNMADSLEVGAREQQEGLSQVVGVVCLTENPLNRIMWAHYAESHQGFVAEFRCTELLKETQAFSACGTPFGPAAKVGYNPNLPTINADHTNLKEVFWTKHEAWYYEEEWRMIDSLKKGEPHPGRNGYLLLQFEPGDLLRVIFGLRVNSDVKDRLQRMLCDQELRHVCKDEVFMNPDTRQLDLRPVS
jgi:hypothetical protein